jgi:hypothetical protein
MTSLSSTPHRQKLPAICSVLAALALFSITGCGDGKSTISGTVKFDGQPVPGGMITFVSSGGELVREGAVIRDGVFQVSLPPGDYRIELSAQKVIGKQKQKGFDGKDEEVTLTAELFPERYNTKTTLTTKVNRGANILNLDAQGSTQGSK